MMPGGPCIMSPVRSNWPQTCWQMCSPFLVRLHLVPHCLFSRHLTQYLTRCSAANEHERKESHMQSTNIRQIKTAIWNQSALGSEGPTGYATRGCAASAAESACIERY